MVQVCRGPRQKTARFAPHSCRNCHFARNLTFMTTQMSIWRDRAAQLLALAAITAGPAYAVNAIAGEVEFPQETQALVAATSALFDAVEAEADRPSVPRIRIDGLAIPASATTSDAVFPTANGPVRHLTGYRITWYPLDHMMGAVDFMGTWNDNRNLVCGYVTWNLDDPAEPVLDQVVANYVDLTRLDAMTPADAQMALLDANCAYGEIDPNFTVFD